MTYIDRINAFNQWEGISNLSSNAFRLYHVLLARFNAVCWPDVLHVSNKELMAQMGTGSYHTVINARKELIDAGLIVCEQGTKGKEYRYALIELVHGIAENAIGIAESATFIDNIYNNYSNSSVSNQRYTEDIKEIIDYLNLKAGTKYRYTATNSQRHIRARLNEGYSVEDCKAVIDNKCSAWHNDANMRKYLRPETLFGNKFDGYLNEKSTAGAVAHTEEYIPDYVPKVRW